LTLPPRHHRHRPTEFVELNSQIDAVACAVPVPVREFGDHTILEGNPLWLL
jgi:hypothetical protein